MPLPIQQLGVLSPTAVVAARLQKTGLSLTQVVSQLMVNFILDVDYLEVYGLTCSLTCLFSDP